MSPLDATPRKSNLPPLRLRSDNRAPVNPAGDFVLYWMIAYRRVEWNFSLERAVEWARELNKPLLILEGLRVGYPWASDRLHRFVLQGMADHARRLAGTEAHYYPYIEPAPGAGKGLLAALARKACLVVTDEYPCFFLPRMVAAVARRVPVRLECVDSNGLLPLRAAERVFPTAYSFRRFLQLNLPGEFARFPRANPLRSVRLPRLKRLPTGVARRWPPAAAGLLAGDPRALARLPLDHNVTPAGDAGGTSAARARLRRFLRQRLARYLDPRARARGEAASGLSAHIHFGHLSTHQVFHELAAREGWSPARLGASARGSRAGWWGMSPEAEAFLDQLITWRELGFNLCARRSDYDRYESLPAWARKTLEAHGSDPRPFLYTRAQFERGETHDALWNHAQQHLVREGSLPNTLRMYWGKKVLEWSRSPRAALRTLIELNNKYALDGRDPNSYSGIFWCLGRYDRPWGPERPVFGTVRPMSGKNTARKLGWRANSPELRQPV